MKYPITRGLLLVLLLLLLLLLLPLAAYGADLRPDYARQWPLQLADGDAGAYRVTLDAAVYRSAWGARLEDVQVLDADGEPMASGLIADPVAATAPSLQPLPLFALPAAAASGDLLQVVAERDANGAVRRIDTRSVPADAAGASRAWLLDASALAQAPQALWLDWQARQPVQAEVRIEGSDDLRQWQLLVPRVGLVDLDNGSARLQQRRIPLPQAARYLRVTALSATLPALSGARAEQAAAVTEPVWQWLQLQGRAVDDGIEFVAPGRFPVTRVDVATSGSAAVEWVLHSRDRADAPWRRQAGPWLGWRVGGGASGAQALTAPVRDHAWRLVAAQGRSIGAPTLRLGWRPETLVFLAQGRAPYALVAGSARARRADAPLAPVLDALRQRHGALWQPPRARLAAQPQTLAGDAALQPAARPHDWRAWLLWALLIGGALVVAGFALSLLRTRAAPGSDD
jgi:hypothetical protein